MPPWDHVRAPFWITGIVLFNFLKSRLPGSMKQFRHFLICRLREIIIELADRIEIFRRVDANKVIHFTSEPITCGKGSHRDGDDKPGGLHLPERVDGGAHAGPRGDAIIYKEDG